ncbi:MAG: glutamyl-tRNA reductase [Truepera sp.]|nr:glutamyl-tRNA reductase [Truepera sp.]
MERLALIGVSHRRGGASAVEAWQDCFDDDALVRLGFDAFVRIATCNRWEVILQLPEGIDLDGARHLLAVPGYARPYAYMGEAAIEHLALVASSIDALNPGEDQVVRQVREAYSRAKARGVSGSLAFAFDTALRIARRVRHEVELAPVNTSLFSLVRPEIEAILVPGVGAAVLGAGEMGTLAATILANIEGVRLTVFNRTLARAQQLATSLRAEARALEEFPTGGAGIRVLVCTTPVRDLVDAEALDRLPDLRLIVDLGLPRNVAAQAARERGVRVLDIDTLQEAGAQRRGALRERLAVAEGLVLEELATAMAAWNERQLAPAIRRLQEWIDHTIETTIAERGSGAGMELLAEDRERLARRVLHVPVKGLRALAREYGLEAARVFLAEAGLAE